METEKVDEREGQAKVALVALFIYDLILLLGPFVSTLLASFVASYYYSLAVLGVLVVAAVITTTRYLLSAKKPEEISSEEPSA